MADDKMYALAVLQGKNGLQLVKVMVVSRPAVGAKSHPRGMRLRRSATAGGVLTEKGLMVKLWSIR
jgi:hypothetical protein